MNQKDLERSISAKSGLPPADATAAVAALLETIEEEIRGGGKIIFRNIGTLYVRQSKATRRYSPRHKQFVDVPARRHLAVKSSDKLSLNGK